MLPQQTCCFEIRNCVSPSSIKRQRRLIEHQKGTLRGFATLALPTLKVALESGNPKQISAAPFAKRRDQALHLGPPVVFAGAAIAILHRHEQPEDQPGL